MRWLNFHTLSMNTHMHPSQYVLLYAFFFSSIIYTVHFWQVIGLSNVPLAGDEFEVVDSLDIAREKAESRAEYLRNERITEKAGDGKVTLSSLASAISAGKNTGLDLHQLNIILKVDVQVGTTNIEEPNMMIKILNSRLHILALTQLTVPGQ